MRGENTVPRQGVRDTAERKQNKILIEKMQMIAAGEGGCRHRSNTGQSLSVKGQLRPKLESHGWCRPSSGPE